MPKPSLEKAAAFAEVSKKTGGIFVFATRDANILHSENASAEIAKAPFAEYACGNCGTHHTGVVTAGLQPFCLVCGSDDVKHCATATPKIPQDSEMSSLTCGGCGTLNVLHDEVASVGESVHCSLCGTSMKITQADVEMPGLVPEVDDMELVDVNVDETPSEIAETTQDCPSDKVSPDLPVDAVEPLTTTQEMPSDKPSGEVPADPVSPGTTLQDVVTPEQMTSSEGEELDVDMTEQFDLDDKELSFVHLGDTLSLMGRGQIIASLSGADAGDNAEILQTAKFVQSVAHTIKTLGLKKAIAQYGFKANKLKVKLSKAVATKVEARVAEQTLELSAAQKAVIDDMNQALDIAAAGFAGNFWRNTTDPLKLALAAELKAMNVRNPMQFVDKVFAAHSLASQRQIIELARDLIKKPIEARNALAQAIDLAKYQPMVVKASEDEDKDEDDTEEDDVEESDVAVIATPVEAVTASASFGETHFRSPVLQKILGDGSNLFN